MFWETGHSLRHGWAIMHNDWLEILWEYGLIGLALAMFAGAYLLKGQKSGVDRIAVLALGIAMLGNWPLQNFWGCFILIYLIRGVYERDRANT